ncbi:hypothetical protein TFLX_04147 [Thermoflexales bacterium]|nr:hypothetical protein TFLX_04147 [Thermoflexales bacterium]
MNLFWGKFSLFLHSHMALPILSLVGCLWLTGCTVIAEPTPTVLPTVIPTVFMAIPTPPPSTGDAPHILSYTLRSIVISGRPAVELTWKTVGQHVEVWTFTEGGYGGRYKDDLPVEGTLTVVSQPGGPRYAEFRLVARGADEKTYDTKVLEYEMPCLPAWFADIHSVCPSGSPVSSRATLQHFEHGRMLWIETPSSPRQTFWVFLNGSRASSTVFQFDTPPRPPKGTLPAEESPPHGFYAPQNDFASLWRYKSSPYLAPFRDSLGWATKPELDFETLYQCSSEDSCLLRDPDGRLLRTSYTPGSGLYWEER